MSCFTPLTLRQEIEDLLNPVLGKYATSDGQLLTALRLVLGSETLPHGWKPSGIECLIQYLPESDFEAISAKQVHCDNTWIIRLVAWGENITLLPAVELLLRRFPRSRYTVIPQIGEKFPKEQIVFRLGDYNTLQGIFN